MTTRTPVRARAQLADIERAMGAILGWATRHDVDQETMRRAKSDLPRGSVWLLAHLERTGPVRLSDVAALLGVDNSTLTPRAKRLERDGLVTREADPRDGRAALLHVTRAGKALLTRLRATRRDMFAEVLAGWSADELDETARALGRLAVSLDADPVHHDGH